ncbi:hypothetical protein BVRB_3g048230 [Beta vulgaris subsp. vulgaris]|nr:hypothetical protein BVRB_3g048230 [Beta vulgaris subsp. vulgaris]
MAARMPTVSKTTAWTEIDTQAAYLEKLVDGKLGYQKMFSQVVKLVKLVTAHNTKECYQEIYDSLLFLPLFLKK